MKTGFNQSKFTGYHDKSIRLPFPSVFFVTVISMFMFLFLFTLRLPVHAVVLPAPSSVYVTVNSYNQFKVEWTKVTNATGYRVQRKIDDSNDYETSGHFLADQTSFLDSVQNGHLYTYRVQAIKGADIGLSKDSVFVSMLWPVSVQLLAVSPEKVEVSWTLPANAWLPDSGYIPYVERRVAGGAWLYAGRGNVGSPSYTDTGLAEGTFYEYRVRLDVGLPGTHLWQPTTNGFSIYTKLKAPQNLATRLTSWGTVEVTWNSTATQAAYTQIERSTDGGEFTLLSTVAAGTLSYSDSNSVNGHVYRYRVRHMNAGSTGDWTEEARIVFLYPNTLTADAVYPDQINLNWTWPAIDPTVLGEARPRIERRKAGESAWTLAALLEPGVTEYRDQNLTPDTVYNYRIQTEYLDRSVSPWYPPLGNVKEVRTGISYNVAFFGHALSSTMVQLEWDFDALEGKTIILEKYDASEVPVPILQTASERSFIDTELLPGTEYTYRLTIRANSGLSSISSEPLPIKTEAVPTPANVLAAPSATNRVSILWNYDFTRESGFEIWRKTTGTWIKVGETERNIQYWTDTALPASGLVQWKVRAVRGDHVYSAFAETESRSLDVPLLPQSFSALMNLGKLKISWLTPLPNLGNERSYSLESRSSLNSTWLPVIQLAPGDTSIEWFLLLQGGQEFRIRADLKGLPVYSGVYYYSGKTPDKPTGFHAERVGSSQVLLQWDKPSENLSGYRIYRLDVKPRLLIGTAEGNTTSYTDFSISPSSSPVYGLIAWNATTTSELASTGIVQVPKPAEFTDLGKHAWAAPAIRRLFAKGIVSGTSSMLFSPQQALTRAEFIKMLFSSLNLQKAPRPLGPIADINPDAWYAEWIYSAMINGLVQPDMDGKINPQQVLTRGEMAVLTEGACSLAGRPLMTSDEAISTGKVTFYNNGDGLANGNGYDSATDMILSGFTDALSIPSEYRGSLAVLIANDLLNGNSYKQIGAQAALTRAEAAVIIDRLLSLSIP